MSARQPSLLDVPPPQHPDRLLRSKPLYSTDRGAAFCGDSLQLLRELPDRSVSLVITSPPYALEFKKAYGNVEKADYVEWFLPFAAQVKRVLETDGSFVLNIGGSYNPGVPTRSLYHFKLLIALCDELGFHLAQECFWYNPAKLPVPAEWVNVRRFRVKDSVEYVWWLAVTPWPKADNRQVLVPYSSDMRRLLKKGYRAKQRPSGHNITTKFNRDHGGSIPASLGGDGMYEPTSLLERGNNESNSAYIKAVRGAGMRVHPARFPAALPDFFIKLLTQRNDLVVDIFAGSNMTGRVAEDLERTWLAFESDEEYVRGSAVRFDLRPTQLGQR